MSLELEYSTSKLPTSRSKKWFLWDKEFLRIRKEEHQINLTLSRTPTKYEQRIDFARIENRLQQLEDVTRKELIQLLTESRDALVGFVGRNWKDIAKMVGDLRLKGWDDIQSILGEFLKQAYDIGTQEMNSELGSIALEFAKGNWGHKGRPGLVGGSGGSGGVSTDKLNLVYTRKELADVNFGIGSVYDEIEEDINFHDKALVPLHNLNSISGVDNFIEKYPDQFEKYQLTMQFDAWRDSRSDKRFGDWRESDIEIHRGVTKANASIQEGSNRSWTLKKDIADNFSKYGPAGTRDTKYAKEGTVFSTKIKAKDILVYSDKQGEAEIVLLKNVAANITFSYLSEQEFLEMATVKGPMFTPVDALRFLKSKNFYISSVLKDTLLKEAKAIIYNAIKVGEIPTETQQKLKQLFEPYVGNEDVLKPDKDGVMRATEPYRIETILRNASGESFNQGRIVEARRLGKFVQGMQYSAILDDRTTQICEELDGRIFRIGDPQLNDLVPPNHHNCLIDGNTVVYTATGWKKIKDITLGDFVLTHTGKFKPVTYVHHKQTPQQYDGEVVKIWFSMKSRVDGKEKQDKTLFLTVTPDHPILVKNQWRFAKDIKEGDELSILSIGCENCNISLPYVSGISLPRFCGSKCIWEWRKKNKKYLQKQPAKERICIVCNKEFLHISKDIKTCSSVCKGKLHSKKIREKYNSDPSFKEKISKASKLVWGKASKEERTRRTLPAIVAASLVKRISHNKIEKPDKMELERLYRDSLSCIVVAKHYDVSFATICTWLSYYKIPLASKTEYWNKFPERHPNRSMRNVSKPQKELYEVVKNVFDTKVELEYPVRCNTKTYYLDIALPEHKIGFEYDGGYWHQDWLKDSRRDRMLHFEGWTILRYINEVPSEVTVQQDTTRVVFNHTKQYHFTNIRVSKVEKWKLRKPKRLYNIAVQDDESYIAKGVVVHNCRSILVAVPVGVEVDNSDFVTGEEIGRAKDLIQPGFGGNVTKLEDESEIEGYAKGNWGHKGRPGSVGGSGGGGFGTGSVTKKKDLSASAATSGMNKAIYLEFEDGSRGVFKPEDGEHSSIRQQLNDGTTLSKHEVFAYELDRDELKLGIVPETVMIEVEGRKGSLQKWINDEGVVGGSSAHVDEYGKVMVFDALLGNNDRHAGNWVEKDGKIYAIDNGMSVSQRKVNQTTRMVENMARSGRDDEILEATIPQFLKDTIKSIDVDRVSKKITENFTKKQADSFLLRYYEISEKIDKGILNRYVDLYK